MADGRLVVLSDRGKLLLVEVGTDKYTEKGQFQAMNELELDGADGVPRTSLCAQSPRDGQLRPAC